MKALFYPFVVIVALALLGLVAWVFDELFQRWREVNAIRDAHWEAFTTRATDGTALVGIRLVARWGRYQRILEEDPKPRRIAGDDEVSVLEAVGAAENSAEFYNRLRVIARRK